MIQSIVVIVFILLVTVACVESGQKKEQKDGILISRETSAVLKGVAILLVFVHHYWQLTSATYNSHTLIGYIGVTIFLLVAGYVSAVSLRDKGKESLTYKFFVKKFIRLYVPYICVKLILGILQQKSLHDLIAGIVHLEDDWFLCAITVLYILFFVTSKISCGGGYNWFMLGGISLYIIACAVMGLPSVWYNTSLAFFIGMMAANHEGLLFHNQKVALIASGVATLVLGALTASRVLTPKIIGTVFSVFLAFFLVLVLQKYQIQNRVFKWIGNISWEFYLFQSTVLVMMGKWIVGNYVLYFLVALGTSVVAGYIVNKLIGMLSGKIERCSTKK